MKKIEKYIYYYAAIWILLFSCNKEIVFHEEHNKSYIVVDGWIENGKFPYVILTRNTPYFTIVDSSSFIDLVITNAKVSVSDGQTTEVLTFGPEDKYFPPYVYRGTEMKGETGKTYYLEVKLYDTILTAATTIPDPPQIDTAWFELKPDNDTLSVIKLQFTDDKNSKNYYRILTNIRGQGSRFIPIMSSTIDDVYFQKPVNVYPILKGQATPVDYADDLYFKIGNIVTIKLCSIDKEAYLFWHNYQFEVINSVNPFASSSINVQGNIKGEGLGIWSGAGVSDYTIQIK
ncbi:MAG: DUF4249 domain-containing protein [Bacteroidales bacterium]|nr:DUF4249 domain-containing protein [Bacteroidales bacterium]